MLTTEDVAAAGDTRSLARIVAGMRWHRPVRADLDDASVVEIAARARRTTILVVGLVVMVLVIVICVVLALVASLPSLLRGWSF